MPRCYNKKIKPKYNADNLERAIVLVCEKKSTIYHAAKECSVPKETLRRRIKQQEFNANKREVGQFCTTMRMKTPFKNGIPEKDWIISHKKRHVDKLRLLKPEILTFSRAKSLTPKVVDKFSTTLSDVIHNNDIVPSSIYNLDETGLSTNHLTKRVFVHPKSKDAYELAGSSGKAMYSVLFCVSADGRYLPPFVVFKGEGYLYSKWVENGPPGCAFGATATEWMQDFLFENWFVEHFIPLVDQDQKPILLLYDGHGSHLTYGTIKAAMDNDIQIICLPPNCSHALQPLDVAVFGPLKNEWRKILKRFERETQQKNIDKTAFTGLFKQLCQRLSPANAIAGFRGSGISPLSKEKMERRITGIDFLNQSPEHYSPKSPGIQTPRSAMREALRSIICPNVSAETAAIIEQQKQKRKRVQAKCRELLTNEKVKRRLLEEQKVREEKNKVKKKSIHDFVLGVFADIPTHNLLMARGKELPVAKRTQIMVLHQQDFSEKKISAILVVSRSAVIKWIARATELGTLDSRKRYGRPRLTSLSI
ncbi:uncharacterized protein LOC136074055 [Hydra vulgaris]|uniref:Uncharacterized protein LOC136074055 n=1 Tax=Hydra vulgaris TaxID=6087 RepID=A0ABM4B0W9_HYDVU